ncbi:MAG TPA: hypothetical protein VFH51_15530 [Myxococcota bacterium]|nr:hypothetical protein [Myxococcota bacterium]
MNHTILLALSCTFSAAKASPARPEDVVSQLERSVAALQLVSSSLAALEVRQAELAMRMGSLFAQLPDRHAGLEAAGRGIAELGPLQATWGQQMDALARASEPEWASLTSGHAAEAALGRVPVILDAPEVDVDLRAREARVLEEMGTLVAFLRLDIQTFYDLIGDLPVITTSDSSAVRSLQDVLAAYLAHVQEMTTELLHTDGVLRHLEAMRYDLRVGLPQAWKERLLAILSRHTAADAGRTAEYTRGIQVALQTQGAVETRVKQWENQFVRLLGQQHCPHLALRFAYGWQTEAREASKRASGGLLPDNFRTHLVAVLKDSRDEAERRIEEAQQVIAVRYARYRRARLRALEEKVSRRREVLAGRCLEMVTVARVDEGVAGEEAFRSFTEGCR